MRKWECGLRPLRAVGSLYEPEAIGAYAYAPAGMRKVRFIFSLVKSAGLLFFHPKEQPIMGPGQFSTQRVDFWKTEKKSSHIP